MEHDAVVTAKLPSPLKHSGVCNLGRPSYGNWIEPKTKKPGTYKLFSKAGGYFPGNHAVLVSPKGAKKIVEYAKTQIGTPDLYLNKCRFPWLSEYYPWPIECHDTFTTLQKEGGCVAKHMKGTTTKDYKIL